MSTVHYSTITAIILTDEESIFAIFAHYLATASVSATRVDLVTVNSADPHEMVQTHILVALSSGPLAFPLLFSKPV